MSKIQASSFVNVTLVGSGSAGMFCLWILDASFKSLILLALGSIVCFSLGRASAAMRHWIWATLLIGSIFMPVATLVLPEWRILPSWISIENQTLSSSSEPQLPESSVQTQTPSPLATDVQNSTEIAAIATEWTPDLPNPLPNSRSWPLAIRISARLLLIVWAIGVLALLIPIAIALIRLISLERASKNYGSLDARVLRQLEKTSQAIHVRSPKVVLGAVGAMPMVWSLGRGRLLLPTDCDQWTSPRLHAVLTHELIHLKRQDPMLFTLGLVARALNWFNPLAWYAVRRLRIECERACDDYVLRLGVDASEYASHLLEFSVGMRPTHGTSSLAFAMATKPNIEQRIVSILDEKLSRHGVPIRRAIALLLLVSCGVALLATLRATVANESLNQADEDKVEIKYPYCVVEVDNLQSRSLAEAIKAFNLESKQSPTGVGQRPISEPETIAAINKTLERTDLEEPVRAALHKISESKTLPPRAYFRRFTRFDDEQQMHGVWWVRLCIEGDAPLIFSVPIRTTHLFTRPYSQLERQQNAEQGVTLINRRSSYYEEPPQIKKGRMLSQDASKRLITSFKKGLADKSIDELKALFNWEGAAWKEFAESELQMLLKSDVHSISAEPLELDGNLLHWSGFRAYRPNLPVVGYLEIEYTLQSDQNAMKKKLSLELGELGAELRLVNYVAEEPKAPAALARVSMSGHTERLADGLFQVTSLISNPGELLSAHLANEEVWHRDYEHKRAKSAAAKRVASGDEKGNRDARNEIALRWKSPLQSSTVKLGSGPIKFSKSKIRLVDQSNGSPLPGIELRIQLRTEEKRSAQSVRATSDADGLIHVEAPEGEPVFIEVISTNWWLIGKVRLDADNSVADGNSNRTMEIKLSRGQPADIFDLSELISR